MVTGNDKTLAALADSGEGVLTESGRCVVEAVGLGAGTLMFELVAWALAPELGAGTLMFELGAEALCIGVQ
jgi:hypothetical protein